MYKIYQITCHKTRKSYIGVTSLPEEKRLGQHIDCSKKPGHLTVFHRAIRKYGIENFTLQIVIESELLSKRDAFELEKLFIEVHETKWPNGYNTADGGLGAPGVIWSDEAREAASKRFTDRWKNEEYRQRTIENMHGNQNAKGLIHTSETKTLISTKLKGRKLVLSNEERQHRADRARLRNILSPPRKGKVNSKEHNRKAVESRMRNRNKRKSS